MGLRDWFSRRSVWTRRLVLLLMVTMALGAILWFTPTSYYITAPGAAIDTSRLIAVPGGQTHSGQLYMLVVTTQPANLLLYLYAQLDHRADLETPEQYLGGTQNYREYLELTRRMMADSQQAAKAIGLQLAGFGTGVRTVGAEITGLQVGSPNQSVIQAGDIVIEMNGQPIKAVAELRALLQNTAPGTDLPVRVKRKQAEVSFTAATIEHTDPARKGTAALGVFVKDALEFDIPVDVQIKSGAITGPSAGMMFTLQIVDQLTPGGISGGRRYAGTGTIEPDGRVGSIGGARQKVYTAEAAGAEVIFVPRANYEVARQTARRITVVPVDHVRDALDWLKLHREQSGSGAGIYSLPFGYSRVAASPHGW